MWPFKPKISDSIRMYCSMIGMQAIQNEGQPFYITELDESYLNKEELKLYKQTLEEIKVCLRIAAEENKRMEAVTKSFDNIGAEIVNMDFMEKK